MLLILFSTSSLFPENQIARSLNKNEGGNIFIPERATNTTEGNVGYFVLALQWRYRHGQFEDVEETKPDSRVHL